MKDISKMDYLMDMVNYMIIMEKNMKEISKIIFLKVKENILFKMGVLMMEILKEV